MAQVTIKGLKALQNMEDQAKEIASNKLEGYFLEVAEDAIRMSPVWSGAYVKSFSFKSDNTSSRGRRIDGARWKFPDKTGTPADKAEGLSLLQGDIKSVFEDSDKVLESRTYTLRNDANHAYFVEYGVDGGAHPPGPKPRDGYRIFEILRSRYG